MRKVLQKLMEENEIKKKKRELENDKILETWEKLQLALKKQIVMKDTFKISSIQFIGGVDVSFHKKKKDLGIACFAVLSYPKLEVVYKKFKTFLTDLPYIPGFLAFRECPILQELIEELQEKNKDIFPQVILVDGCGVWHPREFGLASQLGVLTKVPTIGIAKKLLAVDGWERDDIKRIRDEELKKFGDFKIINGKKNKFEYGAVFRGNSKNPIFISVGHLISLKTSIEIVKSCSKFRIPEPIRAADLLSREQIRLLDKKK